MRAHSFDFGVDHETYRIVNTGVRDDVFFYARPVTPRRGFELGVMALEHVVRERPQTTIHLAGWDVSSYDLPFEHVDYAAMQVTELNDLYNRCSAALVLSLTNLSLLPLELLSSGVIPVVNDGPNNRMVAKNNFVEYAPPSPAALARSILVILDRPDRREHAIAASASVSERRWSKAEQQFLEIFAGEMRG
jgi:glycosyltransferase involved in cell wall biosynthesis